MINDVLEALNKSGFTEYNSEINELVEQIIKKIVIKTKQGKKGIIRGVKWKMMIKI